MEDYEVRFGNFGIVSSEDKNNKQCHIESGKIKGLTLEKVKFQNGDEQIGVVFGNDDNCSDNRLSSPNALLELKSTTGTMLVSRLNEVQKLALVSPISGMVIFNTDKKRFEFYEDKAWVSFGLGTVTTMRCDHDLTNHIALFANSEGTALKDSGLVIDYGVLKIKGIQTEKATFDKVTTFSLRSTDITVTELKAIELKSHSVDANDIKANRLEVNQIVANDIDCDNISNLTLEKLALKAITKIDRDSIRCPKVGTMVLVKDDFGNEFLSIYLNSRWSIITTV